MAKRRMTSWSSCFDHNRRLSLVFVAVAIFIVVVIRMAVPPNCCWGCHRASTTRPIRVPKDAFRGGKALSMPPGFNNFRTV